MEAESHAVSCVTCSRFLYVSEPQSPHLENAGSD